MSSQNFIVESNGEVRMIRLTGSGNDYEISVIPSNVQSYIDNGIARLLTQSEYNATTSNVPQSVQISVGVANDLAVVNWSSEDNILKYHLVVKNNDTGQTIQEFDISGYPPQTNYTIQNLQSGTNYVVYIIAVNSIGNSLESSYNFKTLGTVVPPVVVPPVVIPPVVIPPPIIISADVQVILNKFNNNDYTYPDFLLNQLRDSVQNGSITSNEFLNTFNSLLQNGTIVDTTIIVPPVIVPPVVIPPVVVPPIEETFCVNVYQLNEFGGVYTDKFENIKRESLLILEADKMVVLCGNPIPTDQDVKDFYNYIDVDKTVKQTMVSQRFLAFKIVDGYLQGNIQYVATGSFNPHYNNKIIYSVVQVQDSNGNFILIGNEPKKTIKVNELRFTSSQIDEKININEYVGDIEAVTIQALVSTKPDLITGEFFTGIISLEVVKDDPDGKTWGYHLGFNGKCVPDGGTETGGATSIIGKALGVTALLGTLALLGARRR